MSYPWIALGGLVGILLCGCSPDREQDSSAPDAHSSQREVASAEQAQGRQGTQAPVQLCSDSEFNSGVRGLVADGRLVLQARCLSRGDVTFNNRETVVELGRDGHGDPYFLTSLSDSPLSKRQKIATVPSNPAARELRLHSGKARCRSLLVTPAAKPAVPREVLPKGASWPDALSFLAADDCSLIVLIVGPRAIAMFSDQPLDTRLYHLRLSWASELSDEYARSALEPHDVRAVTAGTPVQVCGRGEQKFDLFGAVVGSRILLRSICITPDGLAHQRRDFLIDRGAASDAAASDPHFLLDLAQSEFLGMRRIELGPEEPATWHFFLSTGRAKCPLLRVAPVDDTPGPETDLGEDQRWVDAVGFLVNGDCSALLVHFVRRGTLLTAQKGRSRLYDMNLSFGSGRPK